MSSDCPEFWRELRKLAHNIDAITRPKAKKRVTVHTVTPPANVVRHDVRHVRPDNTSLLKKRGWKQYGNTWIGHYATVKGTWPGRIERRGDIFVVLIKNPPPEVEHSGRIQCFSEHGGGWWDVHLHTNPVDGDVNAIVDYVERLLHRAFRNAKRRQQR